MPSHKAKTEQKRENNAYGPVVKRDIRGEKRVYRVCRKADYDAGQNTPQHRRQCSSDAVEIKREITVIESARKKRQKQIQSQAQNYKYQFIQSFLIEKTLLPRFHNSSARVLIYLI